MCLRRMKFLVQELSKLSWREGIMFVVNVEWHYTQNGLCMHINRFDRNIHRLQLSSFLETSYCSKFQGFFENVGEVQ